MKLIFALASLFIAFSAQAADKKLGNVIAIEREIPNLYDTCMKNVTGDTNKPNSFFSCAMKFVSGAENPISKGTVFKHVDGSCSVVGEAINGTLLITFAGANNSSTFDVSRVCLETALNGKDPIKLFLYAIE